LLLAGTDLDIVQYQEAAAQSCKMLLHADLSVIQKYLIVFVQLPRMILANKLLPEQEYWSMADSFPFCSQWHRAFQIGIINSARLYVGKVPNDLPDTCDGCGATFTPERAMQCKKGGLVTIRHNDLRDTYHHLCAQAHKPSAVIGEPLIHPCHDSAGNMQPNTPDGGPLPETRGFWKNVVKQPLQTCESLTSMPPTNVVILL
jgi:hypothetical protein